MDPTAKRYKRAIRYYIRCVVNVVAVLTPFVLMALPVTTFDKGQSICLSELLFHTHCYACGMTRGIMHLIHFDFAGAWHYNKLSFIVLPMLFPIWVKAVYFVLGKKPPRLLQKLV